MATAFGKTWWGEHFLRSLSNIDYDNRLPRGASYARNGYVTKIKIDGNRISAKVQGSRATPYKVDIIIPPFFDPELSYFLRDISRNPSIISKLLNRKLDPLTLQIAEKNGLKVFPKQWTDFKMYCSCPDWAVPCKHLAAFIYKLSSEIDNNPFLAFSFHNVDLIEELGKMGIYINKESIKIPDLKDLYFDKNAIKNEFSIENAYKKISFAGLSPIHETLTALLSEYPAFYTNSGDFKQKYFTALNKTVKEYQKVAKGKQTIDSLINQYYSSNSNIGVREEHLVKIEEDHKSVIIVNNEEFSLIHFFANISKIHSSRTFDYQPSTAAMHSTFNLAVALLANGAVIPQIVKLSNNNYTIRWLPAIMSKTVKELVDNIETILPPDLMIYQQKSKQRIINKDKALNLLSLFMTELIKMVNPKLAHDIFLDMFFLDAPYSFTKPGEDELAGGIMVWLQKFYLAQGRFRPVIAVEETNFGHFKVEMHIKNADISFSEPISLKKILTSPEYDKDRFEILKSFAQLTDFVNGLDLYINSGGENEIIMKNEVFAPFLIEIIPIIQLLDIEVLLPKELQYILKPKPSIKLKKKSSDKKYFGLGDLFSFEWQIALGDNVMDQKEFYELLNRSENLIKYKSNYIYVTTDELEKLKKHLTSSKELSGYQMLRAALSEDFNGAKIVITPEAEQLIKEFTEFELIDLPYGLNAELRPYQQRGFSWMYKNAKIGIGSILADDMGLGKTIQVLTTLLKFKEEKLFENEKSIIIAPTGLLTNWEAEIKKFTPSLNSYIYHGGGRKMPDMNEIDIMITSYGVVRSDIEKLKKMKWHSVIIDEAQNIKNHETIQSKAIKGMKARNYIAMSGTPVENRLSELWSIFDYSNKGVLGSLNEFKENFSVAIEQNNDLDSAEKLKKVTSPFLMRRLKTDKKIISDLPDKIEINSYATLTNEQVSLYQTTLEKAMKDIEGIENNDQKAMFVRQSLVLQMILSLKQICNHPSNFLKDKSAKPEISGKMLLLFDKLDSIFESNEKVLIFTQFTEMGDLLKKFINEKYKIDPLFLHGGCSVKDRKIMVDNFQTNHAEKIFILSLKAAGTGLNLTSASHVIHYDLWWNPAVENQATDRAYRIGQKNNVMVHRMITKNTFEEKIDELIQSKKHLANITVATGENWIGKLSNKELREIFEV